jgi:hypothetical protein
MVSAIGGLLPVDCAAQRACRVSPAQLMIVVWRDVSEMGKELATLGSAAAGCGQFRCRGRSVAVAKVGRWLAFCIY